MKILLAVAVMLLPALKANATTTGYFDRVEVCAKEEVRNLILPKNNELMSSLSSEDLTLMVILTCSHRVSGEMLRERDWMPAGGQL